MRIVPRTIPAAGQPVNAEGLDKPVNTEDDMAKSETFGFGYHSYYPRYYNSYYPRYFPSYYSYSYPSYPSFGHGYYDW